MPGRIYIKIASGKSILQCSHLRRKLQQPLLTRREKCLSALIGLLNTPVCERQQCQFSMRCPANDVTYCSPQTLGAVRFMLPAGLWLINIHSLCCITWFSLRTLVWCQFLFITDSWLIFIVFVYVSVKTGFFWLNS